MPLHTRLCFPSYSAARMTAHVVSQQHRATQRIARHALAAHGMHSLHRYIHHIHTCNGDGYRMTSAYWVTRRRQERGSIKYYQPSHLSPLLAHHGTRTSCREAAREQQLPRTVCTQQVAARVGHRGMGASWDSCAAHRPCSPIHLCYVKYTHHQTSIYQPLS